MCNISWCNKSSIAFISNFALDVAKDMPMLVAQGVFLRFAGLHGG